MSEKVNPALFRISTEYVYGPHGSFWERDDSTVMVPICDASCRVGQWKRIRPFRFKLDWDDRECGDLASGHSSFFAGVRLREALGREFPELHFEEIEVVRPKRLARKLEAEYREIQTRRCMQIDPRVGTVELRASCDRCGRYNYGLVGMEKRPHEVKIGDRWEPAPGIPRKPGMVALIPASELDGDDFSSSMDSCYALSAGARSWRRAGLRILNFLNLARLFKCFGLEWMT